jgi:hypothetical protein
MNKKSLAAAGAIAVATFFTNVANATPIRFDFTGTVFSGELAELGQSVSGYIMFETEGLEFRQVDLWPTVTSYEYGDWSTTPGPSQFSSGISLAGSALPVAGVWNEGRVGFLDACNPDCQPGYGESFGIGTYTLGRPETELANGRFYDVNFLFLAMAPDGTNYFDVTPQFGPEVVMTLPLHTMVGLYSSTIWDCEQGECTESYRGLQFSIDTVTRSTTSVPEPGTLGLLGVALGGMLLLRRRTRTLPALLSGRSTA